MWTTSHIDNLKKPHPTADETQAPSPKIKLKSGQEFFQKKPEYYFSCGFVYKLHTSRGKKKKKLVGDKKKGGWGAENLHGNIWLL